MPPTRSLVIARDVDTPAGKCFEPVDGVSVVELGRGLAEAERVIRQYMKAFSEGERKPRRLADEGRSALEELVRLQVALKG